MQDRIWDHGWRRHGVLYPMLLIAAIGVTVLSVLGIAAITGLLPGALSSYLAGDGSGVALPPTRLAQPAAAGCIACGVVVAIRAIARAPRSSPPAMAASGRALNAARNGEVIVKMNDGTYRTVLTAVPPPVRVGERVRVEAGGLEPVTE